jgi:hypothetical protein
VSWKTRGIVILTTIVTITAIALVGLGLASDKYREPSHVDVPLSGTTAIVFNDDGTENNKPSEIDWSTYTPFNPVPKGDAQSCPSEDFVNNKLVKYDNCKTIPKGATGRAKNIDGVWFFVKMK